MPLNKDTEDELDRIFYQELRGKTVTPEQAHILDWMEGRLKPALHRLILKERREELEALREWAQPEPYYSDRIAQIDSELERSSDDTR